MDEVLKSEQKDFFENLDLIIKNDRISHAFFLETNNYSKYIDVVVEMCKNILIDGVSTNNLSLINKNFDYPEIKYLNANRKIIKKEEIIKLKNECLTKPILGKYIIYIIDGAEYLNASSANTLLKFLEEPEENIIGILISNSRYQVINTLISRCQIFSLIPDSINVNVDDEMVTMFIEKVKNKNYELYIESKMLFEKSKEELLIFLNQIQDYCILDVNDNKNLKIIDIIEKKKKELKFNVNLKLFIDNLILELLEV